MQINYLFGSAAHNIYRNRVCEWRAEQHKMQIIYTYYIHIRYYILQFCFLSRSLLYVGGIYWVIHSSVWWSSALCGLTALPLFSLENESVLFLDFCFRNHVQVKWWAQPSLNWARCLQTVLSQYILTPDICQPDTSALIAHQSKEPYNSSVHLQIAECSGQQQKTEWISRITRLCCQPAGRNDHGKALIHMNTLIMNWFLNILQNQV